MGAEHKYRMEELKNRERTPGQQEYDLIQNYLKTGVETPEITARRNAFRGQFPQADEAMFRGYLVDPNMYMREAKQAEEPGGGKLAMKIAGADYDAIHAIPVGNGRVDSPRVVASLSWLADKLQILYAEAQTEEGRQTLAAQGRVVLSNVPGMAWQGLPDASLRILGYPTSKDVGVPAAQPPANQPAPGPGWLDNLTNFWKSYSKPYD